MSKPRSLGELKASGYRPLSVKDELRKNLRCALAKGENPFPGIFGYERTVLPALHNAVLSRHDLLLLGLRGQAKTRLLRMLVNLLDPRFRDRGKRDQRGPVPTHHQVSRISRVKERAPIS
jgi:magnesium chelatase subunit I